MPEYVGDHFVPNSWTPRNELDKRAVANRLCADAFRPRVNRTAGGKVILHLRDT